MDDNVQELWESLTDAQRETVKNWSYADLLKFARANGIKIPDELLDSVTGGYVYDTHPGDFWIAPRWEVIDDVTGDVLKKDLREAEAKQAAKELGQSAETIQWATLSYIRENAAFRSFMQEVLRKVNENW